MTPFLNLALLTLRSPAKAAEIVLAQQWRGEAVWTGLLLVAVLNALTHALMLWLFPVAQELAFLNMSPTALVGLSAGLLVVFSVAVTFCGRLIGGQGGFAQVLPVMIWLQLVRVGIQAVVIVVTLLSAGIGALLSLLVNVFLIYVLLHFVNEAHRFNSLWRAFGVLVMASLLALFTLTFVLGLLGPAKLGLPAYV
ncbi:MULTISPECIES: YIP1 family protein [Rhodobacterales]|jgi:hypothetical protein|uniref:YIP1 family protein n=1 Tax=Rhodobacterales TaxID=204455 RepID=UPI00237F7B99|nr:YIP1 family protein [Phaeobacter gallaeciensis]MDE4096513.1 YIP1 family protein [Phaeobacter gallaeciensis]MDE4105324.1 YIP1 family protein [Phaeobacter gallaeciensis]MDE4109780.1 YIP1 family protein [Phaeobacter gallaeciensis]MDE4114248.1 YIP1 family protein [Phaeobacter gallaeciensis]MDE4118715.1 YIP1 family protein [Phaeobacter gallaeciensis]